MTSLFTTFSVAAYAKTPEEMVKQPAAIVTAFKNFFNILLPSNSNYPTGISVTQNNTNKNVPKGSYLTNGGSTLTVKVTSKKGQNVLANQKYSYDMYKLDNKGNITGSAVLNGRSSSSTGLNDKLTKYTNVGNYALILKTENGGYMTSYKLNIIDKLDTKPTTPTKPTDPTKPTNPEPTTKPDDNDVSYRHYIFILYAAPDIPLTKYGTPINDNGNIVIEPYATVNVFKNPNYQYMATEVYYKADTTSTKAPAAPQIEGYTFLGWSSIENNPQNGPYKLVKANEELPYNDSSNGYSYASAYYSVYVNNKTHVAYAPYNFIEGNGELLVNYLRDENGDYILTPSGRRRTSDDNAMIGNEKLTDEWLLNWLGYIPE